MIATCPEPLMMVMIFLACSSLVLTQRVIWLMFCALMVALSSLICTIALRMVAHASLTSSTVCGRTPNGQARGNSPAGTVLCNAARLSFADSFLQAASSFRPSHCQNSNDPYAAITPPGTRRKASGCAHARLGKSTLGSSKIPQGTWQ